MTRLARNESTPEQIDAAVATSPHLDPVPWFVIREIDPTLDLDTYAQVAAPHVLIEALLAAQAQARELTTRLHDEIKKLKVENRRLLDAARTLNQAVDLAALFDPEVSG